VNVYSVIDIGSNTVHMLVAASDGIVIRELDDVSDHLRLGADLELLGAISPAKVQATARTVRRFVERARGLGAVKTRLLATQAVRAAANRIEVVSAIRDATGLPVSVLEPEREAYFAVLGASLTRTMDQPHLVVDGGGASTQVIVSAAETILDCISVPVGSGRLASRFASDPPSRDQLAELRERVRGAIGPAVNAVLQNETSAAARGAIVVGGAMKRVARLVTAAPLPVTITAADLHAAVATLQHQPAGVVASSKGIEYDRVPMTRAGAIILQEILRAARLPECTISPFGIREGAILDAARTAPWQIDSRGIESALANDRPVHARPA
jgi:exopolyphosphatase/guanosine-5'-triphosphate,3'-diphosphate pyrophosphatase